MKRSPSCAGRRAALVVAWLTLGLASCGKSAPPPPQLMNYEGKPAAQRDSGTASHPVVPDNGSPFCDERAARLYVMDTAGILYTFDPTLLPDRAFQPIGKMNCVWAGASSMAIDRYAAAWVTDRDGMLFKVSTVDAQCEPTAFHQQKGFSRVGMGFAGHIDQGTETLYIADNSAAGLFGTGIGLGRIDTLALEVSTVANFDGTFSGYGAELTGDGDGRLFGFFPTHGSLAEIDTTSGHILTSYDVALATPISGKGEYDFAVSFWGGVFFFYTADTGNVGGPTTDVTLFDPATRISTLVAPQIGFNILGAGSSTCVPRRADLGDIVGKGTLVGTAASADGGLD